MNSYRNVLQDVTTFSQAQKAILKTSNFKALSDIVLTPPSEIAKKLRISRNEAQSIIENVCKEIARTSLRVDRIEAIPDDKFTTGDATLDGVIGGGIRTGMIWELVGESASGKTQLALQLSLLVQVRPLLGGLSGSACYLTTHAALPTKRLDQLISEHPLLSHSVCSLSDIHTVAVPTVELLIHTLRVVFPALQDELQKDASRKPVRLVVIDSLSALFHTSERPSSAALFERSKALSELSLVMHTIAARENIAFLVINDVTDTFNDFYSGSQEGKRKGDIVYRDQAKWFNSAHSIPRESSKEASLGLVWANQLNARIMLTRTNRRRHLDDPLPLMKRKQREEGSASAIIPADADPPIGTDDSDRTVLLRRLSVVFSSVSKPGSVDFTVTKAGVLAESNESASIPWMPKLPEVSTSLSSLTRERHLSSLEPPQMGPPPEVTEDHPSQQFTTASHAISVAGKGPSESQTDARLDVIPSTYPEEVDDFDDDGQFWEGLDEATSGVLPDIDFDSMEKSRVEDDIPSSETVLSEVGIS